MRRTSRSSRIPLWWVKVKIWITFSVKFRKIFEVLFHRVERNGIQSTLISFSLLIFSLFSSFFDNFSQSSSILRNKRRSHVIFKVSKSISKNSFVSKEIGSFLKRITVNHKKKLIIFFLFFILYSLRIFCDNYGDVQTDFPVRIVHSLVIVFEKNVIRSQREFIHWESLRYVVKRQSDNPWITEKDREEHHEEPQQMRIIHFSRDQHGLHKFDNAKSYWNSEFYVR